MATRKQKEQFIEMVILPGEPAREPQDLMAGLVPPLLNPGRSRRIEVDFDPQMLDALVTCIAADPMASLNGLVRRLLLQAGSQAAPKPTPE